MILAEHAVDESQQEQWSGCQTEKCVYHSHAIIYYLSELFLAGLGCKHAAQCASHAVKIARGLGFLAFHWLVILINYPIRCGHVATADQ